MKQAEQWIDFKPHTKRLNEAFAMVPAPPVPDDSYSVKMNALHKAIEGFSEYINTRVEMEQQAEELR